MKNSKKSWHRWAPTSVALTRTGSLALGILSMSLAACGDKNAWNGSLEELLLAQP